MTKITQKYFPRISGKILIILLLTSVVQILSLCHENIQIMEQITTRVKLQNIVKTDQYYIYTFNTNGILEKRDSYSLQIQSKLQLDRYSTVIGGNGNYLFSKSRGTILSISKHNLEIVAQYNTNSDLFIFHRGFLVIVDSDGRYNNILLYLNSQDLKIYNKNRLNLNENIQYLKSENKLIFATNRAVYESYESNYKQLYQIYNVDFNTLDISEYLNSYWLSNYATLNIRNYTGNYNVNLVYLPFEFADLQIGNLLVVSQNYIFVAMKSGDYSETDHNYFVMGSSRNPGDLYSYSHCTFHDTSGGVKGFSLFGNYIYLFHDCQECGTSDLYKLSYN